MDGLPKDGFRVESKERVDKYSISVIRTVDSGTKHIFLYPEFIWLGYLQY